MVETIVAIGLLTTGIVGGLSLAIYAFSASDRSLNQIVATNLAREGVEAVRNIRDSIWTSGTLQDCSAALGSGQQCYQPWPAIISGYVSPRSYQIAFQPSTNQWSAAVVSGTAYRLYYDQAQGLYLHSGSGNYIYSRRVDLVSDTVAPFSAGNPRLLVRSNVWWRGKNCPDVTDPAATTCKIVVEEYLTNWKNY